jgi:DNA invertase Pin-like site-specific DNA recombinase
MLVGYARVSKEDQVTRLQLDALAAAGVHTVFQEKASAVSARPQLRRAIASLRPGDVLVVWKLDRLARSLADLLRLLDELSARGASFRSLTEPVDTSSPMGTFVVQVLGAVAQLERSIIIQRTTAGLRAAKDRGVKLGRQRSLDPRQEARLVSDYLRGRGTMEELAARYGIHPSSVKRAVYRVAKPGHSSLH